MTGPPIWPLTIDHAVRVLLDLVPEEKKREIAAPPKDELIDLHFGLGAWIRNFFGLYKGNQALMKATGKRQPDDASDVIILAFWERLRAAEPKVH